MKIFFIIMAIAAFILGLHGVWGVMDTGHQWGEILRRCEAWHGDKSGSLLPSQRDYAQYPSRVAQDYGYAVDLGKITADTLVGTGSDVFFLAALLFLTSIVGWRLASNKSVRPTAARSAASEG